jgi:multicomponent Na+:H+ antiporter subunit B
MATVLVALDAVDVAMTEAAVGAGISTVLLLGALHLCKSEEAKPAHRPWLPLAVAGVRGPGAGLRHAGPARFCRSAGADPPARRAALPAERRRPVPNVVTAVLASYRGYDTLGETTVVFTAGAGVIALLRRRKKPARRSAAAKKATMKNDLVLRVIGQAADPLHPAVRALRAVPRRLRPRRRFPGRRDLAAAVVFYA